VGLMARVPVIVWIGIREALTLGDATFGNIQENDGRVKLLLVAGQLSSRMQYPAYWNNTANRCLNGRFTVEVSVRGLTVHLNVL
jgi:hypothetical protein